MMTAALGALALCATACTSLSRPDEISISAEPIAGRTPSPTPGPAAPTPMPAAIPAPAPAQGG